MPSDVIVASAIMEIDSITVGRHICPIRNMIMVLIG